MNYIEWIFEKLTKSEEIKMKYTNLIIKHILEVFHKYLAK